MIVPKPESVGLPRGAGNFELRCAPTEGRLVLGCIVPISEEPELLVGRVYSRRPEEHEYSLLGSTEPLESWTSPLPWNGGVLVVCSRVSPATMSIATLNEFVGIKFRDFSGTAPRMLWERPDRSVWISELLNQGSRPDEIWCLVGRLVPPAYDRARYAVAVLDLGRGSVTDVAALAAPAY